MADNLTTQQSSSENAIGLVPTTESTSQIAEMGTAGDEWFQELETNYVFTVDLEIDNQNNIYLLGEKPRDLMNPVSSTPENWVAKYDSAGAKLWSQPVDFYHYGRNGDLVADNNSNIYVIAKPANSTSTADALLVKYDSSGNEEWQQELELDDPALLKAVTDSQNNIYVTGTIDSASAVSFIYNTFVSKYDSSGNLKWTRELDGPGSTNTLDLTVDDIGNVYFTAGATPYSDSGGGSHLVKYDSSGNLEWKQDLPGKQNQLLAPVSTGVVVDSAGKIYVSANITESPNMSWWRPPGTPGTPPQAMLVKYDSSGNEEWQVVWESEIGKLGIDGEGNLYAPETEEINKFDSNGNLIWEKQLESSLSPYWDLELDRDGQAYLIGGGPNGTSPTTTWLAKVRPQCWRKAIANNGLSLNEGNGATITSKELPLPDPSNPEITYTITGLPTHGNLQLNNTGVNLNDTFTPTDIDGGKLTYTHDGSETTRDHFSFTIAGNPEGLNTGFPIGINPVHDEPPTDIILSNNNIVENSETGTVIGELTTTDSDRLDSHTYSLDDDVGGRFIIEGNQLKVADGSKLDFEAATSHAVTVRTTDSGEPGQSFSEKFSIKVIDVRDDWVKSTTNHRLGATKKNLNLIGSDAINGVGNSLGNDIRGNSAKNRIWGKEGNDILTGNGGNDTLIGGAGSDRLIGNQGNDLLNGGIGVDTLSGGAGNDTYIVDHTRDEVKEGRKGGKDLVKSSASYNLGANIENLTLTGKDAINGIGNNAKNRISGNNAKNRILGKAGDDVLIGRGGNDTLTGGGGSDRLIGNKGRDNLDGGVGNDTLTGGGGSDRFIFNTGKSYRKAAPGRDVIRDFKNRDNDRIILDKTTFGALDSKAGRGFSVIAEFDVVNRDAAVASSDAVIVYNENNGKLFYNANGSKSGLGAGGLFATLDNSPQLEANDFLVRA